MVTIKNLPPVSTGVGLKVMGMDGCIYTRIFGDGAVSADGNYIVTLQRELLGNVVETVTTVKNGRLSLEPVLVTNKIFMDAETSTYFVFANAKNRAEMEQLATNAGCGCMYLENIDGRDVPKAVFAGKEVPVPAVVINECGVKYHVISDLASYAEVCKRTYGYMMAQKVACIYKLSSKPGDVITTVVNGVQEHTTVIEEGEVKVQNPGGEAYKMKETKFRKLYEYVETTSEGYELWRPKQELQMWVKSPINIICPLWGGFEVLVTPLININNPCDIYGCNYVVFYGCDTYEGTHQVRKVYVPVNPITRQPEIRSVLEDGHVRTLASIPKVDYVEAPDLILLSGLLRSA